VKQLDRKKIVDFVNDNELKLKFREYGKPGPQLMLVKNEASIPVPGGEVGSGVISTIMQLMIAQGQSPYFENERCEDHH